jgi:anti-sigma regulatory factor (Ser/Thr protein kinase)
VVEEPVDTRGGIESAAASNWQKVPELNAEGDWRDRPMGIHLVETFDAYAVGTSRGVGREMGGAPGARELHRRVERADLKAVADVRRMLRDALPRWGAADLTDTAELLTSELVTNALVHTGEEAWFFAAFSDHPVRRLRVEVRDDAPHHPLPRTPDDYAVSGRGLLLVRSLAQAWGVRPHGPGKAIWFELTGENGARPPV